MRLLLRAIDRLLAKTNTEPAIIEPVELSLPTMLVTDYQLPGRIHVEPEPPPPVVPNPIPLGALADRRAGRYAYRGDRRFATADGDFEPVVDGADPISTRTQR